MKPDPRIGSDEKLARFLDRQRREIMSRIGAAEIRRQRRWGVYALAAAVVVGALLVGSALRRVPPIATSVASSRVAPADAAATGVGDASIGDTSIGGTWIGDWDLAGTSTAGTDPLAAFGDWSDTVALADSDAATSLLPPLGLDDDADDDAAPDFYDDLSWLRFPAANVAAI